MDPERRKQRRLVRNEKARRRRALSYACRYLPTELEQEVFSYMKNPDNGRIDVSMKWQVHPAARLVVCGLNRCLDNTFTQNIDVLRDHLAGKYNFQTNVARLIVDSLNWPRGRPALIYDVVNTLNWHMQQNIARKAFTLALKNTVSSCQHADTCMTQHAKELEFLIELGDWRELLEDDWPWEFNRRLLVEMRDGFDECARESFRQSPSWRQENLAQPLKVLQDQLQYFESQIEYSKET